MKSSVLLPFIVSGVLGVFLFIGRIATAFLFDAPSKGIADDFLRWTIFGCIWGYPVFWLVALVVAIVGLLKDWPAKYLISAAAFPYLVAVAPFFLGRLIKYV